MNENSRAYAHFGERVAAGAIDVTLLICAAATITWIGIELQTVELNTRQDLYAAIGRFWTGFLFLLAGIVVVVSMAVCWAQLFATPGQLLVGCRVESRRHAAPVNVFVALWRGLVLLGLAGPLVIPLITTFFDRQRRGVHDWLSGSVVVVEDESRVSLQKLLEELE